LRLVDNRFVGKFAKNRNPLE